MSEQDPPSLEPLIDEVRANRERLVREHGGLRGWMEYLRRRQQEHPEKLVSLGKQADLDRAGDDQQTSGRADPRL